MFECKETQGVGTPYSNDKSASDQVLFHTIIGFVFKHTYYNSSMTVILFTPIEEVELKKIQLDYKLLSSYLDEDFVVDELAKAIKHNADAWLDVYM